MSSWQTLEFAQLTSRFLFPFTFGSGLAPADALQEAAVRLSRSRIARTDGAWQRHAPPAMYRDELLPHVASYLFPAEDDPCRAVYLRLSDVASNKIFRSLVARLRGKNRLRVELARPAGCEIFLSSNRVGVLSIALGTRDRINAADAANFNYLGAARVPSSALLLETPHPSQDPKAWAVILAAAANSREPSRGVPREAPPDDAPAEARIGAPGGRFTVAELAAVLLAELRPLGLESLAATPDAPSVPSVFTVGRFCADVDFAEAAARRRAAPLLAALTQVEEAGHAPAVPEHLGFPNAVLNSKHWAGCSQVGTAHIVADQGVGEAGTAPEFNHERVQRVLHKYFVPHFVALLEQLTLGRLLREAGRMVAQGDHRPASKGGACQGGVDALRALRRTMLEFAVGGHFVQVSTRHAVHRYFQLARAGLDIQQLWGEARQAIADLDAANAAERQLHLADAANRNLESSLQTQKMMERSLETGLSMQKALHVIEVFLVAVYSAHLMVMLIETLHLHPWIEESAPLKHFLLLTAPLAVALAASAGWAWARRHTHPE